MIRRVLKVAGVDFADENAFYRFLERNLFPRIVRYTIHPLHILVLLLLWIGLLFWHNTIFELLEHEGPSASPDPARLFFRTALT